MILRGKKYFILLAFFLVTIPVNSQVLISLLLGDKLNSANLEFGMTGGLNRSYMSGINEAKGLNHFHLGFYFDFRVKNNWFINTGMRVKSNTGATNIAPYSLNDDDLDSSFADGFVTRRIAYFYVPIHMKYRFENRLHINAGFQVGLRHNAKDIFTNSYFEPDDLKLEYDIRERITRLDAGLSVGLGYKFKWTGMNLGITYYQGLVDVDKWSPDNNMNSTVYIYIDIPIGAGYKEKREERDRE